jgi:hypothetical protein
LNHTRSYSDKKILPEFIQISYTNTFFRICLTGSTAVPTMTGIQAGPEVGLILVEEAPVITSLQEQDLATAETLVVELEAGDVSLVQVADSGQERAWEDC